MANRLHKRFLLLVSRRFDSTDHRDGFQKGPLVFLRSVDEYDKLRKNPNWQRLRPGGFLVSEPIEIEVYIEQKELSMFLAGKPLAMDKVLFSADKIDEIKKLD